MITEPKSPQEVVDQFLNTIKRNMSSAYYAEVVSYIKDTLQLAEADEIKGLEADYEELEQETNRLERLLEEHNIPY